VAGERNADAGYQAWADQMDDPEVAKLLRLNGREETIHSERVDQAIALMTAAG
jgi:rubrerythrin